MKAHINQQEPVSILCKKINKWEAKIIGAWQLTARGLFSTSLITELNISMVLSILKGG